MKLLFFSNIPAPYFVDYLNELGCYCDVYAVFERSQASDRDSSWKTVNAHSFKYSFLKGISIGTETAVSFQIISFIKNNPDSIIVFANPTTPSGIIGIMYCKKHKRPYVLQSEGGLPKSGKGLKESFKKSLIKGANLYLSGMRADGDYFSAYGADPSKIRTYPFASLHEKDLINVPVGPEEKDRIKRELGINDHRMILYVGRIIQCKGIDVLIRACEGMPDDVGVYLIGGKESEPYATIAKNAHMTNLHYIDHIPLGILKYYYMAADVFVLPTRGDTWGLVINEAMTYGLPVITTKKCVAGLQLIENDENGFLIDSEDSVDLNEKMRYLLERGDIRKKMSQNNIDKIKDYTFEKMAATVFEYLNEFFGG